MRKTMLAGVVGVALLISGCGGATEAGVSPSVSTAAASSTVATSSSTSASGSTTSTESVSSTSEAPTTEETVKTEADLCEAYCKQIRTELAGGAFADADDCLSAELCAEYVDIVKVYLDGIDEYIDSNDVKLSDRVDDALTAARDEVVDFQKLNCAGDTRASTFAACQGGLDAVLERLDTLIDRLQG